MYDKEYLEKLRELGWEVRGSLDSIVDLERTSKDSQLRAQLKVEHQGKNNYMVIGVLEIPDIETILRIRCSGQKSEFLRSLRRIIYGMMEAYLSRATYDPKIKKVHDMYTK